MEIFFQIIKLYINEMYCPSKSFSLQLELILSQMSIKVTIVLYLVSHIFLLYLNFYKKKSGVYHNSDLYNYIL